MVRSLALIGAAVAAVVLLVPRSQQPVVQPVDLGAAVQAAESVGDVPVLVPEPGEDWQLTSARREDPDGQLPATWHLGWLTPEEQYAGLEATAAASPTWVRQVTGDGEQVDTLEIDGRTWAVLVGAEDGRTSLLLEEPDRTVVVTGSSVLDELADLAEAALAEQD